MTDLADRVQRVRLLLDTLNDPYPSITIAIRSDSGPAPSHYVPCETCRRRGEVRVRGGFQLCLVCDGLGWKRREDEPPWDAYIELPVTEAQQLPVPIAPRGTPPVGVEESFAWERERARYDRHGSYAVLRVQLDRLALVRPLGYRLVRAVLVEHERRELSAGSQRELELSVVQLALWIPRVRVPGWLIERAREERQETIAELAASGKTAGEIARLLGLQKETVVRKLKRRAVDSERAGVPATAT
jgi:hypothetical protein